MLGIAGVNLCGYPVAAAVFAGGTLAGVLEGFAEAAHGAETGIQGDAEDFLVGRGEEALGVGDAVLGEVIDQGHAERFSEKAHGVVGVQVYSLADGIDGEGFGVTLGDEAGHLLDFVETAFADGDGAVGLFSGRLAFGRESHAQEAGFHFEEHGFHETGAGFFEIGFPGGEELGVSPGAKAVVFGGDAPAEEGMHERFGKFALQEPAQRQGGDEIFRLITAIDDLVREGGPEGAELAGVDADFPTADEVGDPAAFEEIHFDLVVAVGAFHGQGMPAHAGETVGRKVGAAGIEGFHDLRIPELFAHLTEELSRK